GVWSVGCCGLALLTACSDVRLDVQELTPPTVTGAPLSADPAIAIDPASHDLLMSWVAGDAEKQHLFFARSNDGGSSWSAPVQVTDRENDVRPHPEASARLMVTDNIIALAWPSHIERPGQRFPGSNMRFSRSIDGGKTWSSPISIND